ncbi:hypothetical protein [Sphaerothrix gracilis]
MSAVATDEQRTFLGGTFYELHSLHLGKELERVGPTVGIALIPA